MPTTRIPPSAPRATLLACALALACSGERAAPGPPPEEPARVCEGDAVVTAPGDAARFAGCKEITGKLLVKRSALEALELPGLRIVGDRISVRKNARLRVISLPALERIGGAGEVVIEQNAALERADLGGLARAGGGVAVRENPALSEIRLDRLEEVGGPGVEISGDGALPALLLPALRAADYLAVAGCGKLSAIEAPALERVLEVAVRDNPALERISMPALVRIYSDPSKNAVRYGLAVSGNGALRSLRGFPRLEGLGRGGPLSVIDNASLPTCEAQRLARFLTEKGWKGEATICGNLEDECGRDLTPACSPARTP